MKIAIISDTHDNLATLDKFLAYIKENPVQAVIHCGDVASGETLELLAKGYDEKIFAAFGNMDYRDSVREAAKKNSRIELFENFGQAEFNGLKIGFCHHKEIALLHCQKLTEGNPEHFGGKKLDFVFYGHTHKPWIENIGSCQLANPGTLAGMFCQATFAILDSQTKKLELKIISRL